MQIKNYQHSIPSNQSQYTFHLNILYVGKYAGNYVFIMKL